MPVWGAAVNLGAPPMRTITRGPNAGQQVPQYEVRLPGWDDIIHLVPTSALSETERRARQIAQITSLSKSPSPDIIRHLSELGTQIDNVQDALVTLSVLGRVANKVVGRAIPGVGAIATAADALNVMNVFYPRLPSVSGIPVLSHITVGGKRLRRWPASAEQKRKMGQLAGLATNLYQQRLKDSLRTGKIGFGWGEALQILQTSDELTGVGLSLGPIFGAGLDTVFGLLRGARFELGAAAASVVDLGIAAVDALVPPFLRDAVAVPFIPMGDSGIKLTVDWPGVLPLLDSLQGFRPGFTEQALTEALQPLAKPIDKAVVATLGAIGAVQKAAISAAGTVWNASKWIVGLRGALSWETHVELLVAQYLALQTLSPFLQQCEWGELFAPAVAAPSDQPALPYLDPNGRGSAGALSADLRTGPARFALDWVDEAPSADAKAFTQALISSHADLLLSSLEPEGTQIEQRSSPAGRALLAMHDVELLPPFDRSDDQTAQYIRRVSDIVVESESVVPPRALLEKAFLESFPGGDAT